MSLIVLVKVLYSTLNAVVPYVEMFLDGLVLHYMLPGDEKWFIKERKTLNGLGVTVVYFFFFLLKTSSFQIPLLSFSCQLIFCPAFVLVIYYTN